MPDKRPPLMCMGMGGGIAAFLFLVLGWQFLRDGDPFENELRRFHLEQVRQAASLQPDARVVVIVGGSFIKHSILLDDVGFSQTGSEVGLPQAKLVRLMGSGGMRVLDEELQSALIALNPDALLIQDHAPFFSNRYHIQFAFTRHIREGIGRFAGVRRLKKSVRAQVLAQDAAINIRGVEVDEVRLAHRRLHRDRDPISGPREDLMQVMKACRSNGSLVFILPIPSDPRWSIFSADEVEDAQREINQVVSQGLAEALHCPLGFAQADFPDFRHMGLQACTPYTRGLLGKLAQRIER